MKKKKRIVSIVLIAGALFIFLAAFISYKVYFQYELAYSHMMNRNETTDKSREMTKNELFRNLAIIAQKEGKILESSDGDEDFAIIYNPKDAEEFPETTFFKNGIPVDGVILYYDFTGRVTAGKREPNEIRFAMQAFIYIRDRNFSDELQNIIGIVYYYRLNQSFGFTNGFDTKISFDELEGLYEEYDVGKLPHEKQVDILTHAWIYKTGYNRSGIDPKYREMP